MTLRKWGLALIIFLFVGGPLRAETNCAGATYTNPSCNSQCPLANCVDVSFNGDGTLYQCCGTYVPEMSDFAAPLLALGAFLGLIGWQRRRTRRSVPV